MIQDKIQNREKYEWCNIWWEEANNQALPRVLLIGDSITMGCRPLVQKHLMDKAYVDQFATSRAINDPAFKQELLHMICEYPYHMVHFNNGLHGWHVCEGEYLLALEQITALIHEKQPDTVLMLATTTPVTERGSPAQINVKKDLVITRRNKIIKDFAEKHNLIVNDLYKLIIGNSEVRSEDGSHYKSEGLSILAGQTAALICKYLD